MSGEGALHGGPLAYAPLQFRMASGGRNSSNSLVACAKCQAPAFIRDSEQLTEKVKHLICHCTNSGCGHVFKMELAFVHTLVPGNIDRPDLDLPVCPREQVTHILPPPRGANDADQISMFDTG
ncbi:ogr/Delta-like zinc finger family protein [Alteraurantiacibacter buctensis]|uniref:Zinc finger Ogr/Delta-type domain-containing protein n=1 Tax=Alteraurantiacibacter buctensis TaxID=1503981 RepID=A0A844Z4D8_9SPHN|nr:ogr/Delta-like zinc finger family protein [Alteraurantiacibacter buctensis]MXO73544.1 hypothetical protein [Alteraurantiacibacter buctensis]